MSEEIVQIGHDFWNIRGKFKIAGLLNVGTQASLIRLPSGRFIFLDSYTLTPEMLRKVYSLTKGGKAVEAILNLHPFHTVHCEAMSMLFPKAKLYGSSRHKDLFPYLPWEDAPVESPEVAELYGSVLDFSLPRGVDYISDNQNVHFSSLLAYHKPSGALHVDDTLTYFDWPKPLGWIMPSPRIAFHPTLGKALEKRPGAAADFTGWAQELGQKWAETRVVCAAHSSSTALVPGSFPQKIEAALGRVSGKLAKHRDKYG
ncbi:hypothetical protein D6851_11965 [Altericroceibacterium spongiae]|uniref:MBL fold metallo-hydrolase n=1 Tax=Altericroceibacterium spongiae TaxID=2320269 RepID=A0A420EEU7_9SPHN|nr:hypothetical protein [Altericroceibacterium spongiae]RKF19188.1 hypothetical protein D6851_11965 [Altericroceibacterium spongiae]